MYDTDLTDSQWQVIQEIVPDTRCRKHSLLLIINALLYVSKSGCQWRLLPHDFPPFPLVYYYFRRWQSDGRWARPNQALVRRHRQRAAPSHQPSPSVAVLDAQSIKCSERGVPAKGFDEHKKIQGRKRQFLVDTGRLLLATHDGPRKRPDGRQSGPGKAGPAGI
jgi:putative transposase